MRVAMIVVSILVVFMPSKASKSSCMGKTEARQHFGSVHVYPDHCWDATPTRGQIAHRVQRTIDQP
jgi:hypothetical protein